MATAKKPGELTDGGVQGLGASAGAIPTRRISSIPTKEVANKPINRVMNTAADRSRAAAQDQRLRGIADARRAYDERADQREAARRAEEEAVQAEEEAERDRLNAEASAGKRQAYMDYMMGERNRGQQVAASGLSGGASGGLLARAKADYAGRYGGIENQRLADMGTLSGSYQQRRNAIGQEYDNEAAEDRNARAQQIADVNKTYQAQLEEARRKNSQRKAEKLLRSLEV